MNQSPLVSVLVPCYNVSDYVVNAVHSILRQTYSNLEVWLIDDASTDDTLAKLRAINDKRIIIAEFKENTRKVGAVNTVLKQVQGELITFMDADDWSEPNRIQEQVHQFVRQPDLGVCFTNYRLIGKKKYKPEKIALIDEELKDEFLLFRNRKSIHLSPTMCATMMITKEVLRSTKGYHPYFAGRVAEDIHWVYRILKSYKGVAIDKPLYNINHREGSLTGAQVTGRNSKAAYSWHLLSKIIHKDLHEKIDVLDSQNIDELKRLELLACEEALAEAMKQLHDIKIIYETSWSFKIGKALLSPLHFFKRS